MEKPLRRRSQQALMVPPERQAWSQQVRWALVSRVSGQGDAAAGRAVEGSESAGFADASSMAGSLGPRVFLPNEEALKGRSYRQQHRNEPDLVAIFKKTCDPGAAASIVSEDGAGIWPVAICSGQIRAWRSVRQSRGGRRRWRGCIRGRATRTTEALGSGVVATGDLLAFARAPARRFAMPWYRGLPVQLVHAAVGIAAISSWRNSDP